MGCAEGHSPFAGVWEPALSNVEGVSLRYNFFPLPGQSLS